MNRFLRMSDVDVAGKRVLIRADLNVPQDDAGAITDDTRIRASLPGIRDALDARRRRDGDVAPRASDRRNVRTPRTRSRPSRERLAELLGREVPLVRDWVDGGSGRARRATSCCSRTAASTRARRRTTTALARRMAALCDVYVNDAFGTAHRAEATTHGIARHAKVACAGPLMAAELDALGRALARTRSGRCVAIVGGSKVSTKLTILEALAAKVDLLIVGGGIANTFILAATGSRSASRWPSPTSSARRRRSSTAGRGKVPVPIDAVVRQALRGGRAGDAQGDRGRRRRRHDPRHRPDDRRGAEDALIANAGTIVWNGPVGVFEMDAFAQRHARRSRRRSPTRRRSRSPAAATRSPRSRSSASPTGIDYISTAGGAFLEFLEGKTLPAVAALEARG